MEANSKQMSFSESHQSSERSEANYSRSPVVAEDSVKVGCLDCGAPYPFGLDLVLPDQQWNHIVPGGSGVLCPSCISKRAHKLKGATVILAWIDHFDWTAPRPAEWFRTLQHTGAVAPATQKTNDP
jgi:hypothetical protein